MVTKQQLDQALEAWHVARETALREHEAWRLLLSSHGALIESLRSNGHTWARAQAEFQRISDGHSEAYRAALSAMDERCLEYKKLREKYDEQ
ncbi:hypothetical protein WL80_28880 [Burkholderia ubonensis]|uniref:hypothetical protein n=1 Tax=Burkholderia ubonensis TaxID=101571 RepID=UPI000753606A|nr:hypothetical protein [Burkholderia ubonensis]KWF02162.1 hypothetical protein WL80_28880 [Burkholderia ubonensis]